jgi:predicted  nucleic acid-binding Zn-ribbon protein
MHKQLRVERTIFFVVFALFLTSFIFPHAMAASPIEQLFETLRFDPQAIYGNGWFVDLILFLVFFIGLTNRILGERLGKPAAVGFGLMMAVGLNIYMASLGKNLASFGGIFALAFVAIMIILLYHLLNATPLHSHPWVVNALTFLAAMLAIVTLGSSIVEWMMGAGSIAQAIVGLLTILTVVAALVVLGFFGRSIFQGFQNSTPELNRRFDNVENQLSNMNTNLHDRHDSHDRDLYQIVVGQQQTEQQLRDLDTALQTSTNLLQNMMRDIQTEITDIKQTLTQLQQMQNYMQQMQATINRIDQFLQTNLITILDDRIKANTEPYFTRFQTDLTQIQALINSRIDQVLADMRNIVTDNTKLEQILQRLGEQDSQLQTYITSIRNDISTLNAEQTTIKSKLTSAIRKLNEIIATLKNKNPGDGKKFIIAINSFNQDTGDITANLGAITPLLNRLAQTGQLIDVEIAKEGQREVAERKTVEDLEKIEAQIPKALDEIKKHTNADQVKKIEALLNLAQKTKIAELKKGQIQTYIKVLRTVIQSVQSQRGFEALTNVLKALEQKYIELGKEKRK